MKGLTLAAVCLTTAMAQARGTFINMDAWCFWNTPQVERMNEAGLKADIDFYTAKGGVEALVFNMNFQRTFFDTKAWTPYERGVELKDDGTLWVRGKRVTSPGGQVIHGEKSYIQMYKCLMAMKRNCPNYMQVRYDYCHEKGVECWWSMRMNDPHWLSPGLEERPQHSDFWYYNKERLTRAWYRRPWFPEWHWENYIFDYAQKEVYDYNLALVREYLLDYQSDGLELDWLRAIPAFRPGFDEAGSPILTQFLRDVKEVARAASLKWGHAIRIGVRVPTRVQEALDLGMDVPGWAKEGLVDLVVPSPKSVRVEQDTQVALWKRVLPPNVIVAPALDMYAASGWPTRTRQAMDMGFASNFYHQGADNIYVFNHFEKFTDVMPTNEMQTVFANVSDRDAVSRFERRHILTWRETCVEGQFAESPYPGEIAAGSASAVRINLGEKTSGRVAKLVMGFTHPATLEIWCNTVKCGMLKPIETPPAGYPKGNKEHPTFYYELELPVGAAHDGWNVFDLHNVGDKAVGRDEFIWTEVVIAAATAADRRRAYEAKAETAVRLPPEIRTKGLERYSTNVLDYAMNNGLGLTKGGRLWASWISGGDGARSFTVAAWSDDGGETWTDAKLVIDGHGARATDRTNIIGTFWLDPDGRFHLFTDQSVDHFDGRAGVWESVCEDPDAEEPKWSAPRRLCHGHLINKPIVLRDGTWAMSAYLNGVRWEKSPAKGAFPELDAERGATCYVSRDHGKTWEKRGTAIFSDEWQESQLVEMDGFLRVFARVYQNKVGCMMVAESKDGGFTWSAAHSLPSMDQIAARFQVVRLKSGRLLFVKHGEPADRTLKERSRLTAYLSDDDGATWKGGLLLDGEYCSYPDCCQGPDGTIYVSHDHGGRDREAVIMVHRFTEDDILAKRIVSPKSRLGIVAIRAMGAKRK